MYVLTRSCAPTLFKVHYLITFSSPPKRKNLLSFSPIKQNRKTLPILHLLLKPPNQSTMPRQRRSAPAPRQQTRSAHTAAAPPAYQQHPQHSQYPAAHPAQPQTQRQPGLFGQMASTAAGVAVGSTIGHTLGAGITGMFGGRSEAPPVEQQQQQQQDLAPYQQQNSYATQEQVRHCDADARNFTRCLEENDGNMQTCGYYLQQLKACQEAARQY